MQVTLIDHMGSDLSVVNAARVSFDKQSEPIGFTNGTGGCCNIPVLEHKDKRLISYLAKHNHWTPFGHCFASFRIKAPLFCARQLAKHQIGLVWNETSRRYVDSEPEFYIPETWRKRAENVKQGSSDELVVETYSSEMYQGLLEHAEEIYAELLVDGVCPEQARMVLPQSMLTEWVWSGSLAAFARVCKLRLDPHTQKETRQVAEMIDAEMRRLFPVSWEALMET